MRMEKICKLLAKYDERHPECVSGAINVGCHISFYSDGSGNVYDYWDAKVFYFHDLKSLEKQLRED